MISRGLDAYGALYGVIREEAELDDPYCARILDAMLPEPETRLVPYDSDPYRFCELDPSVYSFRVKAEYVHDDINPRCLCKVDFVRHVTDMSECPIHPKSIADQVREALVACAGYPATCAEHDAFRKLAAVITDAGAEQLRRFLR